MRLKPIPEISKEYARNLRHTLGNVRPAPRRHSEWNGYVRYLRTQLLGLTQRDFWSLFDVNLRTGSKYECTSDNPNLTRQIPEDVFHNILETLELEWEEASLYGQFAENGTFHVHPEGRQALEMLEREGVTLSDLAALITLHRHYKD
jgi:hypothetical protein